MCAFDMNFLDCSVSCNCCCSNWLRIVVCATCDMTQFICVAWLVYDVAHLASAGL